VSLLSHGGRVNGRCVACGATDVRRVETITARAIAEGWRREDLAAGQTTLADSRAEQLLRALPPEIAFDACERCGLQMASPDVVWIADEYPADQSYPVRWEFHECLNELGERPLDVLELGCGTGELLALASERGHRAVGIDFSSTAIARARERGVAAFEGTLDDLARHVPAGTQFDAVVLFHVIEHLSTPDVLFDAIARWVRPAARLFLSCPGPRRYTRLIDEQRSGRSDFWDYPPQHVLRWTLPALRTFTARHGWRSLVAKEEPLSWVGAASHIGIARAMYRGRLHRPVQRRLTIAGAWARLLTAPADRRAGVSLYLSAVRDAGAP